LMTGLTQLGSAAPAEAARAPRASPSSAARDDAKISMAMMRFSFYRRDDY
jgi:hypothetical protein